MVIERCTVQLSAQDIGRSKLETAQTERKLNIGTLALIFVCLIVERVFIANVGEPTPEMPSPAPPHYLA